MKIVSTLLASLIAIGGAAIAPDAPRSVYDDVRADGIYEVGTMRTVPPAPWSMEDPADSLYREAREALNRGDYRRAADLFGRIPSRYPQSEYAADAMYWQAFALYRAGGTSDLRKAQKTLKAQKDKYPKAKTRGDAETLEVRIAGQLAGTGDAASAGDVIERAGSAAKDSCNT